MKDNFSTQATAYARFRPRYPAQLIDYLAGLAPSRRYAWDAATGNGQLALALADHFDRVLATDISARQLEQAPLHPRVEYRVEPAEACSAPDQAFDFVAVAQAVHWFHFDRFYAEIRRVLRPGGVLALIGYGLFRTENPAVNAVVDHFYRNITGPYWDPERSHIDAGYATIPFPFERLPTPEFDMKFWWTQADMLGFLNSWSAVQHYRRERGSDPLALIGEALQEAWGATGALEVRFPLLLRVGARAVSPGL